MGTPVWSHGGIVCTGETYKNVRRAIDIHEGDKVDEAALKDHIRAAVALNLGGKNKPKSQVPASTFLKRSSLDLIIVRGDKK